MLKQADRLDLMFHALADQSRRSMVDRLTRGPATVSELAEPLPISLPAVVGHIKVLEASGLVTSEKRGRVRTCRIEVEALTVAEQWINDRRTGWDDRLDRLGAFLAADSPRTRNAPPRNPDTPTPRGHRP